MCRDDVAVANLQHGKLMKMRCVMCGPIFHNGNETDKLKKSNLCSVYVKILFKGLHASVEVPAVVWLLSFQSCPIYLCYGICFTHLTCCKKHLALGSIVSLSVMLSQVVGQGEIRSINKNG